ncbi:basic secretory protein-like protein [Pedobacter miscanthi]|uniref:Secretory protein n=1 Tax=Pedobacter miscanthi TaxID=2259170 RepID=A0A366LDW3_9SPHI|nr:basic secretory protein-like protein [Pedobacter miscanthi]RBQ12065.1 secretory protein [Pedobacter miscanthi]
MIKHIKKLVIFSVLIAWLPVQNSRAQSMKKIRRNGLTLKIIVVDTSFNKLLLKNLVDVFFEVYPKMVKAYNPGLKNKTTFVIDTAYHGVAATSQGSITFSHEYISSHPQDVDVVTHELMHVVQDYKESIGPGWLTEGIADYVRDQLGINNLEAKWSLGNYMAGQHYKDGYQVAGRFLKWIEYRRSPGLVKEINDRLRMHTYSEKDWKTITGMDLGELWQAYRNSPKI